MASVQRSPAGQDTAIPAERLYRVTYVDTVVRERFVAAHNEQEAENIVEAEIADAGHHHAIDAYHDDLQVEQVASVGRRPTCFECGHSSE